MKIIALEDTRTDWNRRGSRSTCNDSPRPLLRVEMGIEGARQAGEQRFASALSLLAKDGTFAS
jgi:hypothetical protein